jgi:hypothetical protein
LALSLLRPDQWERFETFASEWLAPEFPELRPVAAMAGDGGTDAVLWQPSASPSVVVQYSVASDWAAKIRQTAKRIREHLADAKVLIYLTSQEIGTAATAIREELLKDYGLYLDVRDRQTLISGEATPGREQAAESLAKDVVDPYMEGAHAGVEDAGLTSGEAETACVYLALQWQDEDRNKGLTRLSFEAIVRSVLRDTDSDHRISREEVHRRVRKALPAQHQEDARRYTDSALERLEKRYLRHWRKEDEFCLTHEEAVRLRGRLTDAAADEAALRAELERVALRVAGNLEIRLPEDRSDLLRRTRRVLERVLIDRGEAFAAAVRRDRFAPPAGDPLKTATIRDLNQHPDNSRLKARAVPLVVGVVSEVMRSPAYEVRQFLRSLADSYTLYAFLRETPDVQATVLKLFGNADVWLDASVLLPLFGEDLLDPADRGYTNIFQAASEAGLNLYVTEGVLEEVNAHIRRCLAYARRSPTDPEWRGRVPFLFTAFSLTGKHRGHFAAWIETFRGHANPIDDIADYARQTFGIRIRNLEDEAEKEPEEFRYGVQELFHAAQEARERELDPDLQRRLVAHDVENYVGVTHLRRRSRSAHFGQKHWWLTLDGAAFKIGEGLKEYMRADDIPAPPTLSPDFMVSYLSIGPLRNRISKQTETVLPLATDLGSLELLPHEVLEEADKIRGELADLRPHVIDRRVRDGMDAARQRLGPIARDGAEGMQAELVRLLRTRAGMEPAPGPN